MLNQLLTGVALVAVTVIFQAVFTVTGLRCLEWLEGRRRRVSHHHAIYIIVFFVFLMFFGIVIDVCIWAVFYYKSGALAQFEEALYFSASTFTTLGYGDIVPSEGWRLIASFEAANGLIIFGWSTAFIMAAIQHSYGWHRSK